ncbi:GreA/GreB family elongation factor [Bacillus sp. JJ1764]|uniref:GreA/GreB family elongation factor n=1 Tax=Bacillus sp. JJ1764 TaxID=3122964 RepID=UPI002FFFAF58
MNHSVRSNREYFLQQLGFIDENIKELTNLYLSSTPVQERMKHFFNLYALELEELLKRNHKKSIITVFPKVFIGTKVTIKYDDDDETEDYVICFPDASDPDQGLISFMSPVGRQLLLKEKGEKIALKIPSGEIAVSINEISFVGDLFEMEKKTREA